MYKLLLLFLLLTLAGCTGLNKTSNVQVLPTPVPIVNASEVFNENTVQDFAQQVAEKNGLSQENIMRILNQAQVQPEIIKAMNRPFERLSWAQYQKLYVRPSLIAGGGQFWKQNQAILTAAEKQYGVPVQIIMAIFAVETNYGKNIGQYRALDSLYTLSFYYPRRAAFFQNQLADFLVLTAKSGFDPLTLKSSYAGALGILQFMPSTYLAYAVSSSGQYPDLFTNTQDAVESTASYLEKMGWRKGQPVAVRARLNKTAKLTDALENNTYTLREFKMHGIQAEAKLPDNLKADLVILNGANGTEYWLAFRNFYVIKKYNYSDLYAMAVYQLAQKISCIIPAMPYNGISCAS